LSSATSFFAVSINSCVFISVIGGSPNIFNWRLAPSAADGHETASANHRSSNKPPWPPASKSRRTRFASPDARVANKADGPLLDTRVVYCGDNLEQLAKLPDACVDLIYIDPPFNSNRNYEVFLGRDQGEARL
jgi:hypothetical protein